MCETAHVSLTPPRRPPSADDLIVLFTAWELTSITSYLLIGNQHRKIQARAAAVSSRGWFACRAT